MSKQPAKVARIYLDQHALHGAVSAVEMDVTQELPDVTCLSDNGPRVVVGNYGHKHAVRGFYNGSSSEIDAIAQALIGSTADHYLAECFAGATTGSVVYESVVQSAGNPIKAAVGGAVMQDIPVSGAGGMSRGLVILNATLGATTDGGVSIDQGATWSTASGPTYQATFRFLPGTTAAWTNAVLQVQHSSDNVTFADSTALVATSTGNEKAVRTTTTAVLNRYVRVVPTTITIGASVPAIVTGGVVA